MGADVKGAKRGFRVQEKKRKEIDKDAELLSPTTRR
jgi:hypothetical protein